MVEYHEVGKYICRKLAPKGILFFVKVNNPGATMETGKGFFFLKKTCYSGADIKIGVGGCDSALWQAHLDGTLVHFRAKAKLE